MTILAPGLCDRGPALPPGRKALQEPKNSEAVLAVPGAAGVVKTVKERKQAGQKTAARGDPLLAVTPGYKASQQLCVALPAPWSDRNKVLATRQVPEERKIFINPLPAFCFKVTAGPRHFPYRQRNPVIVQRKDELGKKQGSFLNMECKG